MTHFTPIEMFIGIVTAYHPDQELVELEGSYCHETQVQRIIAKCDSIKYRTINSQQSIGTLLHRREQQFSAVIRIWNDEQLPEGFQQIYQTLTTIEGRTE